MCMRVLILAVLCAGAPLTHAHGDVHERIEHLSEHIARHPGDAELLIKRGRLYLDDSHASEARSDLARALQLAPQHFEAFYYLAQAEQALGEHAAALLSVERFVERAQNDAARGRGLMLRGDILLADDQPLASAEAYETALAILPEPAPDQFLKAAEAYHAGGSQRALEVLDRAIKRLGPLTALEERALSIEQEAGRYEDALRRVERMLATNQRLPFLLYRKGLILAAAGQGDLANQTLGLALEHIDTLPAQRRNTRAVEELRLAVKQAIEGTH